MRKLIYRAAAMLGLNSLARVILRRQLLVLSYHGVCGDVTNVPDLDGLHVPVGLFEEQLNFLLKNYHPVSLSQVRAHFWESAALPSSAILITFDDGFRNVARYALPVLRGLGVPCVLFPVPGTIEAGKWLWNSELEFQRANSPDFVSLRRGLKRISVKERHQWLKTELDDTVVHPECEYSLLNWDELAAELSAGRLDIGSHGLNHEPLTGCEPFELRIELSESRRLLQERLNVDAEAVAYPNGDTSPSVIEAAREAGYRLGFTTVARHIHSTDDPLALPRILVGRWDVPSVLAARLAGWQEWLRV